jgi:hypothetical protein
VLENKLATLPLAYCTPMIRREYQNVASRIYVTPTVPPMVHAVSRSALFRCVDLAGVAGEVSRLLVLSAMPPFWRNGFLATALTCQLWDRSYQSSGVVPRKETYWTVAMSRFWRDCLIAPTLAEPLFRWRHSEGIIA